MLSMNTLEVVEGHSQVDSKSWIEPFCGDMQKPPFGEAQINQSDGSSFFGLFTRGEISHIRI